MKNLLYKELRLAIHPVALFMPLLGAMLLIPEYPYFIAFMYVFITIPIIFTVGKENKDVYFSVLLPVRKRDIVKARVITVIALELLQIIIAVPFAMLNNQLYPYGNAMLMDANLALFGFVFIMYAVFNLIFFTQFYKTAYKISWPIALSGIFSVAFAVLIEFLVLKYPDLKHLLDTIDQEMLVRQIPILAAGIIIYALSAVVTYKKSAQRFEKLDVQ